MHACHESVLVILCIASCAAGASAQKAKLSKPVDPSELKAIPDYMNASIALTWLDNATNETSYQVFRSEDGGSFGKIATLGANVKSHTDMGLADNKEFRYKVRAVNAAGTSGFTGVVRQNLKTVWPVAASHEILHAWNETIGEAGLDELGAKTGFHMGVDIQRVGSPNAVVAVRGGVVTQVAGGPNGVVVITVKVGAGSELIQTNHTHNPAVALNDVVHAGQKVAEIDDSGMFTHMGAVVHFVDHTHYVLTDVNYAALQKHPLGIFGANADKDPQQKKPQFFDHGGIPAGTVLYQAQGAAPGVYLPGTNLEGDVDLIVELRDEQGTLPDQVPTKLAYWIEAPDPFCGFPFHDVKSAGGPYVLFSWANLYFGDAAMPLDLSEKITDQAQNWGPNIMVGGETYPWENYKHYIVTNTKGTDGVPANVDTAQHWNTNAKEDGGADTANDANYAGKMDTTKAVEARFPDGDYTVHVLASDLVNANEDLTFQVRLENFCPIVCKCRPPDGTMLPPETVYLPGATVTFNEPMDTTIDPQTIISVDNAAVATNAMWTSDREITFDIENLSSPNTYHIKVSGVDALDRPGTPGHRMLDGNQDGVCGDDHECTFQVGP